MLVLKWNGGNGSVGGRRSNYADIFVLASAINFLSFHVNRLSSIYGFVPPPRLVCVELHPGPKSEFLDYAGSGQKWARKAPVSLSGQPLVSRPPVNLLKEVINEEKEEKKEIKSLVKRDKKLVKKLTKPILGKRKRKNKKKKNNTKGIICPKCGCSIPMKGNAFKKKKNNRKRRKIAPSLGLPSLSPALAVKLAAEKKRVKNQRKKIKRDLKRAALPRVKGGLPQRTVESNILRRIQIKSRRPDMESKYDE